MHILCCTARALHRFPNFFVFKARELQFCVQAGIWISWTLLYCIFGRLGFAQDLDTLWFYWANKWVIFFLFWQFTTVPAFGSHTSQTLVLTNKQTTKQTIVHPKLLPQKSKHFASISKKTLVIHSIIIIIKIYSNDLNRNCLKQLSDPNYWLRPGVWYRLRLGFQ